MGGSPISKGKGPEELPRPGVVTVTVSGDCIWPSARGEKTQAVPLGKPLQLKATTVAGGLTAVASTLKLNTACIPAATVTVPESVDVIKIGGPRVTSSVATWLLGSPPPDTVAVLVKWLTMFCGMFTFSVITGSAA